MNVRNAIIGSLAILTALPLALSSSTAPPQDDIEALLEECDELLKRSPTRYHIRAYEKLAAAEDVEALALLKKSYKKPGFPRKQTPFLVASAIGQKGSATGINAELTDWLDKADDPHDAWLWRNVLKVQIDEEGTDRVLEIARNSKEMVLRAAAIEALAAVQDESLYVLIPELCKALPKKDIEKVILMGAMVTAMDALGTKKSHIGEDWPKMALSLIATMEDGKTPRAAQLILARHLQAELEAERLVLEPDAWRGLIAAKKREAKAAKKKKKKAKKGGKEQEEKSVAAWPKFFGVDVTGDRVCYLIDLSDSMAQPIPDSWKPAGGPTSGPSKRKKWTQGEIPTEADIP